MAFTFGFYNSLNGDRKYDARQVSAIFKGLINDGVYATVGNLFAVEPGTGLQVTVDTGKAWFNETWNENDAKLPLTIQASDLSLDRFDAVVIDIDQSTMARRNQIIVKKGTAATNPVKPAMTNTTDHFQHPLAYIRVRANATSIAKSDIEVVVGKSECPFVTGIIQTTDLDNLFIKWEGDFEAWFENIQAQLEGDVVTNLLGQIDQCVKKADKATAANITNGTANKWVDAAGVKSAVQTAGYNVGDIRSSTRDLETETNGQFILCDERLVTSSGYPTLMNVLDGNYGGYDINRTLVIAGSPNICAFAVNADSTEYALVYAQTNSAASQIGIRISRYNYNTNTYISSSPTFAFPYSTSSYTNFLVNAYYNGTEITLFCTYNSTYRSAYAYLLILSQASSGAGIAQHYNDVLYKYTSGYDAHAESRVVYMHVNSGAVYAVVYLCTSILAAESSSTRSNSSGLTLIKFQNGSITTFGKIMNNYTAKVANGANFAPVKICVYENNVYAWDYMNNVGQLGINITSGTSASTIPSYVSSFFNSPYVKPFLFNTSSLSDRMSIGTQPFAVSADRNTIVSINTINKIAVIKNRSFYVIDLNAPTSDYKESTFHYYAYAIINDHVLIIGGNFSSQSSGTDGEFIRATPSLSPGINKIFSLPGISLEYKYGNGYRLISNMCTDKAVVSYVAYSISSDTTTFTERFYKYGINFSAQKIINREHNGLTLDYIKAK